MCMLHLPTSTAPAARRRRVTSASSVGMLAASVLLPAVVRTPAASILSLRPMGMPCSGPRQWPAACSLSSALRLRQRLFAHHRDPGVDLRIERLDAVEAGLRQFDRRDSCGRAEASSEACREGP